MGISTDAKLCYGIPLEEDSVPSWDDGDAEEGPAWLAYYGEAQEGVELVRHCSDSCTMYILAIEGTAITAWRGHPQRVQSIDVQPGWFETLEAYRNKYGLVAAGAPDWWLCSWLG